jgi:bacteriorhodopsin
MLQKLLLYLTIGVSITWLYDIILRKTQPEDNQFNNIERLFITLIWPLAILWTIYTISSNRKRGE